MRGVNNIFFFLFRVIRVFSVNFKLKTLFSSLFIGLEEDETFFSSLNSQEKIDTIFIACIPLRIREQCAKKVNAI